MFYHFVKLLRVLRLDRAGGDGCSGVIRLVKPPPKRQNPTIHELLRWLRIASLYTLNNNFPRDFKQEFRRISRVINNLKVLFEQTNKFKLFDYAILHCKW